MNKKKVIYHNEKTCFSSPKNMTFTRVFVEFPAEVNDPKYLNYKKKIIKKLLPK